MTPPAPETPQGTLERLIEQRIATLRQTFGNDRVQRIDVYDFDMESVAAIGELEWVLAALRASEGPREPEWRCFHCDEVFIDKAEAREHFGSDELKTPACQLSADDVKRLRELESDNAQLRHDNEELENDSRLWHESEADRVRRIGNHQWWFEMDYREGEKLVLLERIAKLEAEGRQA